MPRPRPPPWAATAAAAGRAGLLLVTLSVLFCVVTLCSEQALRAALPPSALGRAERVRTPPTTSFHVLLRVRCGLGRTVATCDLNVRF
eukprot:COSAG01_NODE_10915_length_2052_cov_4.424987_2_plen_88_part_00